MDEIHGINERNAKKQYILQIVKELGINILATVLYAVSTYMFVLGNDFAPSGFSGILAMIEAVADLKLGTYVLLAMNLPLLIYAFFAFSKRFAAYTTVNVIVLCGTLFILGVIDVNGALKFNTDFIIPEHTIESMVNGELVNIVVPQMQLSDFGKKLFCCIISGVFAGISIAFTFKYNGCLGGVDIIVMIIQKKKPHTNVSTLLFTFNVIIIILAYFVFKDILSICFAVIYILIFSKVTDYILKGTKQALKFEVVTESPDELSKELIEKLGHSVTVTKATGMFEHKEKYLLICVIRNRQISEFEKILKKYPDTFAYASSVSEVFGIFYKK